MWARHLVQCFPCSWRVATKLDSLTSLHWAGLLFLEDFGQILTFLTHLPAHLPVDLVSSQDLTSGFVSVPSKWLKNNNKSAHYCVAHPYYELNLTPIPSLPILLSWVKRDSFQSSDKHVNCELLSPSLFHNYRLWQLLFWRVKFSFFLCYWALISKYLGWC